ncbi:uncharacterized membrane protein YkvA (DUF1232 family) [Labrys monachus]|uniref:Uncharacterized membrane protein YkvA (DUF1232 family) n=2 Tax=Labrys monachus TaxID=217067 RepID=A0ABU0FCD3_9HYPH|nr:uncharacterized membrane protein YkvA (DUF1232 family) [Labrys monachus]
MPKSGSTFLSTAVAFSAKLKRVDLVPDYGRREQELCEIRMVENAGLDYVAQHHIRHSQWSEKLCRDYGVCVVVLIRSLFDVVVSLRDHVRRESPVCSMFYLEKKHVDRSNSDIERMVATLAIPWYVNFYMGWRGKRDARIVLYEDLIAAPEKTVCDILDYAGIAVRDEQVAAGVARASTGGGARLNVGVAGRGRSLDPGTVSLIMDMLAMYPEIADDPYVRMMKLQADAILASSSKTASAPMPVAAARPAVRHVRGPFPQRAARYLRRKSRMLGKPRNQFFAWGLLIFALLYCTFFYDFIPDNTILGRLDDVLTATVCAFVAGKLLTRVHIRRVPIVAARQAPAETVTP